MSRRARGAALVLVLWLVALLTALVGAFALSARVEHLQQRVQDDSGRGEEIGRAAVAYAMWRLRPDPTRPAWQPDGRLYRWSFDDAQVDIRIEDEAGKVNPNLADAALLSGLLTALGETPEAAQSLAGAILDWRDADDLTQPGGGAELGDYQAAGLPYGPRNARFETLGELQRVLGMRPALFRVLRPLLTLHGRRARPDPRFARAPVLAAMGLDAEMLLAQRAQAQRGDPALSPESLATGSGTYSIDVRVTDARGRTTRSLAVARNADNTALGRAYTMLGWEQGMAVQ